MFEVIPCIKSTEIHIKKKRINKSKKSSPSKRKLSYFSIGAQDQLDEKSNSDTIISPQPVLEQQIQITKPKIRIGNQYQATIQDDPINVQEWKQQLQKLKVWQPVENIPNLDQEKKRMQYLFGRELSSEDCVLTLLYKSGMDRIKLNQLLLKKKKF